MAAIATPNQQIAMASDAEEEYFDTVSQFDEQEAASIFRYEF